MVGEVADGFGYSLRNVKLSCQRKNNRGSEVMGSYDISPGIDSFFKTPLEIKGNWLCDEEGERHIKMDVKLVLSSKWAKKGSLHCSNPYATERNNGGTGVHEVAGALGEMSAELRNCAKLVVVCLEVFIQNKKLTLAPEEVVVGAEGGNDTNKEATVVDVPRTAPSHNVQVVDLSGGPNSDNFRPTTAQEDASLSFPPGLISEWMDDTIMMGNMIQLESVVGGPVLPKPAPGAAAGSSVDEVSVPPAVRGRMQVRLGDESHGGVSQYGGRRRSGMKGKMIEKFPKETKKSGKLQRSSRELAWEVYGTKTIGVTFPT
ncbi:hypothetical protein PIB30_102086, partial [Stylosanthes scabra]|nr:hypothetical protein [Stylosanthes scabra]